MSRRFETIWKLMAGQRLRYGSAFGALAISSGLLTLAPVIPQATIDAAIAAPEARDASALETFVITGLGGAAFVRTNLWWPALVLVGITAAAGLFAYLRGRWAAIAAEAITRRLRDRLYDRLQRLPCTYLDHAKTGVMSASRALVISFFVPSQQSGSPYATASSLAACSTVPCVMSSSASQSQRGCDPGLR